jgi:uncharacterized protein YabE (DUF348 family)
MQDDKDPEPPASLQPYRRLERRPRKRLRWLILWAALGVFSLLSVGFFTTLTDLTVADGATVRQVSTHQLTVEGVLREAGIELAAEDVVSPSLDQSVADGMQVKIHRAIAVDVYVNGSGPRRVRTQSRDAAAVLRSIGLAMSSADLLKVNGQFTSQILVSESVPAPAPAVIELERAVDVTISEGDGAATTIQTTVDTVGEALMQAGHIVRLADRVYPPLDQPVAQGMQVTIHKAKPISVIVDGRLMRTRTHQQTVGDALAELKIVLYGLDYATPSIGTSLQTGMEIKVTRVRQDILINQDAIPFDTFWTPNSELELDSQVLAQEGRQGVRERRTLITYENGFETGRQQVADFVARSPQPQIYNYGTKIVIRTLDTPQGPVEYWRTIRVLATSYSASTAGVAANKPNYGVTRCGTRMQGGIVAVDPRVIPLRTNVYVEGYGKGHACDTGNAIIGKRIDLGYDDDSLKLWYRWTTVYLLTPVPGDIRYTLD